MESNEAFEWLSPAMQKWVISRDWDELREIQCCSIEHFHSSENADLVLSASTSSGKTEAALLPILSAMEHGNQHDAIVVYISPLKALINDLYQRIDGMLEGLPFEKQVVRWHGDVAPSKERALGRAAATVLLITPESLQAMWIHKPSLWSTLENRVRYVIVDEIHAFYGTPRGVQLQMLLEYLGSDATRIGLSATLHAQSNIQAYLRPTDPGRVAVKHVAGRASWNASVRGYLKEKMDGYPSASELLADLESGTGSGQHLIFPASRELVEYYTSSLNDSVEKKGQEQKYFAHHGRLAKSIRENVEFELRESQRDWNVVCTSTLELGIDIGDIQEVHQIDKPPSVASLRQRIGRSGRREGQSSRVSCYVNETHLDNANHFGDAIRFNTFLHLAMIEAMEEGWVEPSDDQRHRGILVQQVVAWIARHHGSKAKDIYQGLCVKGPFQDVSSNEFKALLQHLGSRGAIEQHAGGLLLLSASIEKRCSTPWLYASFEEPELFQVFWKTQLLGKLEVGEQMGKGSTILLAGRRWSIQDIRWDSKTLMVAPSKQGDPLASVAGQHYYHADLMRRVRSFYQENAKIDPLLYLDDTGARFYRQGKRTYDMTARDAWWYNDNEDLHLMHWSGGACSNALIAMLNELGISARASTWHNGEVLVKSGCMAAVKKAMSTAKTWTLNQDKVEMPAILPKWNWWIPELQAKQEYIARYYDTVSALKYSSALLSGSNTF